jgi:hypothetical protein
MTLEKRDLEMLCVSIPTIDLLDIRDELDRLEDVACRLEKVLEALVALYSEERIKNWEMILQEMVKKEERKKGNYGNRTG